MIDSSLVRLAFDDKYEFSEEILLTGNDQDGTVVELRYRDGNFFRSGIRDNDLFLHMEVFFTGGGLELCCPSITRKKPQQKEEFSVKVEKKGLHKN